MNTENLKTVTKSIIIILILLAVVFALRAPAADLNYFPDDVRNTYVDSNGLPYFSEMDSYYNLRLTENFVNHGYVGDTITNNTEMDMHRLAPSGQPVNYEMGIVYVTSFLHDIAQMFGDFSVREVAFWAGAIISCLAVIPAFIFSRRLTNDYGAIVATLLIVLAPNYFAHTFPGFFDTDMFYYIFSLFFVFFFMEALRTNNRAYKVIFGILSIVALGLFSQCWQGYIFYVGLFFAFIVIYVLAKLLFKIKNVEGDKDGLVKRLLKDKDIQGVIILIIIAIVILGLFKGMDVFTSLSGTVNRLFTLQAASRYSDFPNVLVSIAEMQVPNLLGAGKGSAFLANSNGAVNGIGGIAVLFAALFALYFILKKTFQLRKVDIETDSYVKPKKSERKSASKKISDQNKLNISLKDIKSFRSLDEIYNERRINLMYAVLFVVWIIVAIAATCMGSRFITTLVLPFALLAGMFVGSAVDYVKNKSISDNKLIAIAFLAGFLAGFPLMQINMMAGALLFALIVVLAVISVYGIQVRNEGLGNLKKYIIVVAIVLALVSPTICGAYQTANNVVPGTSDAMWDSMVWIDENMPADTVITSWWDFGYLFEYAADKQVTFDGGSQSGERAFWLGQAMSTDNLELSAGIFRMLNSEGTNATVATTNVTHDNGKSTEILINILPLTKEDAKSTLMNNYSFTSAQADNVVQYTHPDNIRPTVFVASSDMLQKAGWWSYFGAWNFETQNSTYYQYYVPYNSVTVHEGQSGSVSLLNNSGIAFNVVIEKGTGNNTTNAHTEAINLQNNSKININGTEFNPLKIGKQIIVEDGYVVKNETIPGAEDANYTLFLVGYNDTYTPILMSNELENSMFTRLFLLGGGNQNIFTCVHTESGISLWQVNFNNTVAGGASGTSTNVTK